MLQTHAERMGKTSGKSRPHPPSRSANAIFGDVLPPTFTIPLCASFIEEFKMIKCRLIRDIISLVTSRRPV